MTAYDLLRSSLRGSVAVFGATDLRTLDALREPLRISKMPGAKDFEMLGAKAVVSEYPGQALNSLQFSGHLPS